MVGTRRDLISVCPLALCRRRLMRRSLGGIGDDGPVGEPHDTRTARGHALIVGDENERGPASRRGVEQFREHLGGGAGVEGAGRFVGEGHHRLRDLGAGNGHALGLTAGELADALVEMVSQAESLQPGVGVLRGLSASHSGEHGRERDIVDRGEFRQEQTLLEDEAEDLAAQCGAP